MKLVRKHMGDYIIIFGLNDLAELAYWYLKSDTNHIVRAFVVNKEFVPESKIYKPRGSKLGFPVVAFEDVEQLYPPENYKLFAPIVDNKFREKIYLEGLQKGYRFISYVSNKATVLTEDIGKNCFILEDNTIQPFVKIEDNVIIWSKNHLGHDSNIGKNSFITSQCTISGHCNINKGSYLGVGCIIRDGIEIGENCTIGMGAVVVKNTEPDSTYIGFPAKKK